MTDRTPKPCLHAEARHEHGTRLAYTLDGCRCYPCALARSTYTRGLLTGGRSTFVDAAPVREHVRELLAGGMGTRAIAAASGVSRSGLRSLLDGRKRDDGRVEPPKRHVTRDVADRLLAVSLDVERMGGAALIDSTGTRRRLRALAAIGWSNVKLARELGMTPSNYGAFLARPTVLARHAREVRELYDRLSATPPTPTSNYDRVGIERVKAGARRNGWVGPLAWDDETIDDPAARPDVGRFRDDVDIVDEVAIHRAMRGDREVRLRIAERAEVIRRLVALGLNDQEIERRTGISSRTALRIRHADDADAWSHEA